MKKKIFLLIILTSVILIGCKKESTSNKERENDSISVSTEMDTVHTTQNSIDWEGEYKGIIPCEDCDGVETSLVLNFDSTFILTKSYIGKGGPYESSGVFRWDESGRVIMLEFDDGSEAMYLTGEGTLSLLNDDGSPIEGEDYVLRK